LILPPLLFLLYLVLCRLELCGSGSEFLHLEGFFEVEVGINELAILGAEWKDRVEGRSVVELGRVLLRRVCKK
jgi:hypothetical protein